MRDLGTMGEHAFSLWCADVGLIANGSQIDKTGWDYFVEFPFNFSLDSDLIHKSAIECKVQVKSTDDRKGKIPVLLSNLRRLITAQMPSFFVFIEFDGKSQAQNGYVVHVDNKLISKVLKRLHGLEQSEQENRFNKRTMTIHYDESHRLDKLDGATLKKLFLSHIGSDMTKYVERKIAHLKSTGYEDGSGTINFVTDSKESFLKLIDVSLGLATSTKIKCFKGTKTRFGIKCKTPFIDENDGRIEMPGVKPTTSGKIIFKNGKLGAECSFPAKLFISPFNQMVPREFAKVRIEGDFFDIIFYPFTGKAQHTFSFGEGVRLEIHEFRDALMLLDDFCTPSKVIYAEFDFNNFSKINCQIECLGNEFKFENQLKALNSACEILSYFGVREGVDISLSEISYHADEINQFNDVIKSDKLACRAEFYIEDAGFIPEKEAACISLTSVNIGNYVFGIFLVITGDLICSGKDNKFEVLSNSFIKDKKIITKTSSVVSRDALLEEIAEIEQKYSDKYQVIVLAG